MGTIGRFTLPPHAPNLKLCKKGIPMNRSMLFALPAAALLLVSAIGCGASKADAEKKLIGKWELDTEAFKAAMKEEMKNQAGDGPGAEMGAQFGAAMMEGMLSSMKMTFEFQKGGKLAFTVSALGQTQTETGTWKVVSTSGKKVVLEIGMGDKDAETGAVTFVDDDTIEIEPPTDQKDSMPAGMSKLTMNRVE